MVYDYGTQFPKIIIFRFGVLFFVSFFKAFLSLNPIESICYHPTKTNVFYKMEIKFSLTRTRIPGYIKPSVDICDWILLEEGVMINIIRKTQCTWMYTRLLV